MNHVLGDVNGKTMRERKWLRVAFDARTLSQSEFLYLVADELGFLVAPRTVQVLYILSDRTFCL